MNYQRSLYIAALSGRQSEKGLFSDGTRPPPGLKKPSIFDKVCETPEL